MSDYILLANILGVLGILISTLSWQLKSPRLILICNIPSCLLWAVHFYLISAPVGVILNLCSMTKDGLISTIKKKYFAYIIALFLLVSWGFGFIYFTHWYDALPLMAGASINLVLLDRDNRELVSRGAALGHAFWAVYCIFVSSYLGLICSIFIVVSSLIGMARHEKWEIGACYKSFLPNLMRSLMIKPQTYP